VVEGANGQLLHFERLGWLAIGVSIASLWLFRRLKSVE
jgi:MFS transporter, DHA1 family, inner membrane transport protein